MQTLVCQTSVCQTLFAKKNKKSCHSTLKLNLLMIYNACVKNIFNKNLKETLWKILIQIRSIGL